MIWLAGLDKHIARFAPIIGFLLIDWIGLAPWMWGKSIGGKGGEGAIGIIQVDWIHKDGDST